jgi:hypothetical protein
MQPFKVALQSEVDESSLKGVWVLIMELFGSNGQNWELWLGHV